MFSGVVSCYVCLPGAGQNNHPTGRADRPVLLLQVEEGERPAGPIPYTLSLDKALDTRCSWLPPANNLLLVLCRELCPATVLLKLSSELITLTLMGLFTDLDTCVNLASL